MRGPKARTARYGERAFDVSQKLDLIWMLVLLDNLICSRARTVSRCTDSYLEIAVCIDSQIPVGLGVSMKS